MSKKITKIITSPISSTDTNEMIVDSFCEERAKRWEDITRSEVACRTKKNKSFHGGIIRVFCTREDSHYYSSQMNLYLITLTIIFTVLANAYYIVTIFQ